MSLVLLNLLAVTRLLPVHPLLMAAVAILFLLRVTFSMRDTTFATEVSRVILAEPESLPATPTYASAKTL